MANKNASILAYKLPHEARAHIEAALADGFNLDFQQDDAIFQAEIGKRFYDIIFIHCPSESDNISRLLDKIKEQTPDTPVILIGASNDPVQIDQRLAPMVYDIHSLPLSPDRIRRTVRQALYKRRQDNELAYLRRTQDIIYSFKHIIAASRSFKAVLNSLKKFAASDSSLLITGDAGTGKSFLSGTIHYNSPRREYPFIKINCANIPETLLESELFGHTKGAFIGADKQRTGRFKQADGGTIFFDEIGEIPLNIQSKLLRVLENQSFKRMGDDRTIKTNVRFIAATNKNLPALVAAGKFLEDLYRRIHTLSIRLPPLQERPDCRVPLARKLLAQITASLKKGTITDFTSEVLATIQNYSWPGNIHQLANTIEQAAILEKGNLIGTSSFRIPELNATPVIQPTGPLNAHERTLIIKALAENSWVQKDAARCLGISPRVLNYKIKIFGITYQRWRKYKGK